MKRTLKALAAVAVCALVSSCATISNPVTATTNPLGSKCSVAKSKFISLVLLLNKSRRFTANNQICDC